jgi:hypothetical protein
MINGKKKVVEVKNQKSEKMAKREASVQFMYKYLDKIKSDEYFSETLSQ